MLSFEWDENKNATNIKKHKINFEEASTVFLDDEAILIEDPDHSDEAEDRFLLLGMSFNAKILIVCHCYRNNDETIRLISARKANKREIKQYFERR